MSTNSRWRDWQPEAQKFSKDADRAVPEVTKLLSFSAKDTSGTFGTAYLDGVKTIPPIWDSTAWSEDFEAWCAGECTFRDGVLWSVKHLHISFRDWCLKTDRVPCRPEAFDELLDASDFECRGGLVSGLFPKSGRLIVNDFISKTPRQKLEAAGLLAATSSEA